jgi:metal-responsive CopG/Arc/MetJ family transcriptional regulator
MKHNAGLTIDSKLLKEIESIRGRGKRSSFIEYLIELGLRNHKAENKPVRT